MWTHNRSMCRPVGRRGNTSGRVEACWHQTNTHTELCLTQPRDSMSPTLTPGQRAPCLDPRDSGQGSGDAAAGPPGAPSPLSGMLLLPILLGVRPNRTTRAGPSARPPASETSEPEAPRQCSGRTGSRRSEDEGDPWALGVNRTGGSSPKASRGPTVDRAHPRPRPASSTEQPGGPVSPK